MLSKSKPRMMSTKYSTSKFATAAINENLEVPVVQKRSSLKIIYGLAQVVSEGLTMIIGLENQVGLFELIFEEFQESLELILQSNKEIKAQQPQNLFRLEEMLTDINAIVIRLQASNDISDELKALKETRTLISLQLEANTLVTSLSELVQFLDQTSFPFQSDKPEELEAAMHTVLEDNSSLDEAKQIDEKTWIPLLSSKIGAFEVDEKEHQKIVKDMKSMLTLQLMSQEKLFNSTEMLYFDELIRKLILYEQADIQQKFVKLHSESLGEGAFGAVDLATYDTRRVQKAVVLKTIDMNVELLKDEFTEFSEEIDILRDFESPFFVHTLGVCLTTDPFVHFLFEKMNGSLHDYIYGEENKLTSKQFRKLARDVSLGLHQLHILHFVHRNLNLNNILLPNAPWEDRNNIKIADFGLGFSKYSAITKGVSPYAPPEVFVRLHTEEHYRSCGWTTKGDVFSLGLILWEVSQKTPKYPLEKDRYNLKQFYNNPKSKWPKIKIPYNDSSWIKATIKKCLFLDPANRLNAKDVCEQIITKTKAQEKEKIRTELLNMSMQGREGFKVESKGPGEEELDTAPEPENRRSIYDSPAMPKAFQSTASMRLTLNLHNQIKTKDVAAFLLPGDLNFEDEEDSEDEEAALTEAARKRTSFKLAVVKPAVPKKIKKQPVTAVKNTDLTNSVKNALASNPKYQANELDIDNILSSKPKKTQDVGRILSSKPPVQEEPVPAPYTRPKKAPETAKPFYPAKKPNIRKKPVKLDITDEPEAKTTKRNKDYHNVELKDAVGSGGFVELAIKKCNFPKKLSKQILKLDDKVLDQSVIDLSNNYSKLLRKKKLGDNDCEVVGNIIKYSTTKLNKINLEGNNITDDGLLALSIGLSDHPTLWQLLLGDNKKISDPTDLIEALKSNKNLETLGLQNCSIDNEGARCLGELLKSDCAILELDVSFNSIGNRGLNYIAKGLLENSDLAALVVNDQKVRCNKGMKNLQVIASKNENLILNKRLES